MTGERSPERAMEAAATWCGLAAAVIGAAVLAGWGFDVPFLKTPIAGTVTMKPNTALLFLLLGGALASRYWREHAPRASATAIRIACGIAVLVAGLTIVEYAIGAGLAIDEMLFPEDPNPVLTFAPGRMAPPTALCFVLIATAIALIDGRSRRSGRVMRALATIAATIAAIALLGYYYQAAPFHTPVFGATGMAFPTAMAFSFLSFGVLVSRIGGWTEMFTGDSVSADLARKVVPVAVAAFIVIGRLHLEAEKTALGPGLSLSFMNLANVVVLITVVAWGARLLDQAQSETREIDERFRVTFEQAAVGLAHVAADGTFLRVNETFGAIAGHSRDEMLKKRFQEITHPDDLEADVAQAQALLEGAIESYSMEKRYFRRDRSVVWINLTASIVREPDGTPKYFIAVIEDITRRKAAERALAQSRDDLERRVGERTAELQSERDALRETTAQLTRVNHELETFSYAVSHDLRAPLRGIEGFASLLQQRAEAQRDEVTKAFLARIRGAATNMAKLIDALLQLSSVSRGSVERRSVDLCAIAGRILGELRDAEPHREVAASVEETLVARADPILVEVALRNLIGNAWKFTSKTPSATIDIGASDGTYFVRDNGAGFEMEYASQLFAPFHRLHAHQEFEGTGIGLATVQRIVHRHGGDVWAESSPGAGATFFFTLGAETSPGEAAS